jgi:hypothetical protein
LKPSPHTTPFRALEKELRGIAVAASRVRETFVLDVVEQESGTNSKLKQRLEQMREQITQLSSQQRATSSSSSSPSSPASTPSRQLAKASSLGKKGPGFHTPKHAVTSPSTVQNGDSSNSSISSSSILKSSSSSNITNSSSSSSGSQGKKALFPLLLPDPVLLQVFSFLQTPDILSTAQVVACNPILPSLIRAVLSPFSGITPFPLSPRYLSFYSALPLSFPPSFSLSPR